jgi:hypothetical protein
MRALEAQVAFHGQAYRQGGDEYMVLLPGMSRELALTFLDELRRKQAALEYPEVPERTTVSIGLCVADPDCPLTDRELREKANTAETFAKQAGRNCIATYRTNQLLFDDLYVAAPTARSQAGELAACAPAASAQNRGVGHGGQTMSQREEPMRQRGGEPRPLLPKDG